MMEMKSSSQQHKFGVMGSTVQMGTLVFLRCFDF